MSIKFCEYTIKWIKLIKYSEDKQKSKRDIKASTAMHWNFRDNLNKLRVEIINISH